MEHSQTVTAQVLDFSDTAAYEAYMDCSLFHENTFDLEDWASGERHALVQVRPLRLPRLLLACLFRGHGFRVQCVEELGRMVKNACVRA